MVETLKELQKHSKGLEEALNDIVINEYKLPDDSSIWGNTIAHATIPAAATGWAGYLATRVTDPVFIAQAKEIGQQFFGVANRSAGAVAITATVGGIAASAAAATWGSARIISEGYHQIMSPSDANIGDNFKESLQKLQNTEENVFEKVNEDTFKLLQRLEGEVMKEGQKTSPNLNLMKKNLLKAKILREAMCAELSDQEKIDSIMKASTDVIGKFYKWANIQEDRSFSPGASLAAGIAAAALRPYLAQQGLPGIFVDLCIANGVFEGVKGYISKYISEDEYEKYLNEENKVHARKEEQEMEVNEKKEMELMDKEDKLSQNIRDEPNFTPQAPSSETEEQKVEEAFKLYSKMKAMEEEKQSKGGKLTEEDKKALTEMEQALAKFGPNTLAKIEAVRKKATGANVYITKEGETDPQAIIKALNEREANKKQQIR